MPDFPKMGGYNKCREEMMLMPLPFILGFVVSLAVLESMDDHS